MARLIDIVSSRVKGELFRILFGLSGPELHMRELVRQSGLSLGTIQQELRHLTEVGLIHSRKNGNRVYFSANKSHPAYPELCSLVLKTEGLIGVLSSALESADVPFAFVFGSVASGKAKVESDIDLMVLGAIGLRKLVSLLSGLPEKLVREINSHVMKPEEFLERFKQGDHFVTTIMKEPKLFVKGNEDELRTMGS